MSSNRDSGCDSQRSAETRDLESKLASAFMPYLNFGLGERFFPVDLRSTIRASSLWLTDPVAQLPTARCEKQPGTIDPLVDLPAATGNHFTTVAGFDVVQKVLKNQPPFDMPVPQTDLAFEKYANGSVGAELTIYATVCQVGSVPNAHLFKGAVPAFKEVAQALPEGLILNYYMYFPACTSTELESEGDWSGISLLIPYRPTQLQDLTDPQRLQRFLPVVAAYYRKTMDGAPPSPYFVAANGGFRQWKNIEKGRDPATGLETHPVVHISLGRHNCYYEALAKVVPLSPPWQNFSPDQIENGDSTPGPANNALKGGGMEDLPFSIAVIFPWMYFFAQCATGCHYPVRFDTSGLGPGGYVQGEDKPGQWDTGRPGPQGSSYPEGGRWPDLPPQRQLALKLSYVDLNDPETAALWRYVGAWGAATQTIDVLSSDPQHPYAWGQYRGARRPSLAAWFLWNLFVDHIFGCGGNTSVTPVP